MTLEEIDDELVNGFHDAVILESKQSYENATVTFVIDVLIEIPGTAPKGVNRYRRAELLFTGVELYTIETPDAESAFPHCGGIWFKFERLSDAVLPSGVSRRITASMMRYSLFVLDWHSNINIAAADVQFCWLD